jgi:hypothetical protein
MNTRIIGAAIGALLLGGSTLANAHGLDDLFRFLPHPERRADDRHDDHAPYRAWHREYRGFARHDEHRWDHERMQPREEHRFEARRDYDRDDHPGFAWQRHGRYER